MAVAICHCAKSKYIRCFGIRGWKNCWGNWEKSRPTDSARVKQLDRRLQDIKDDFAEHFQHRLFHNLSTRVTTQVFLTYYRIGPYDFEFVGFFRKRREDWLDIYYKRMLTAVYVYGVDGVSLSRFQMISSA